MIVPDNAPMSDLPVIPPVPAAVEARIIEVLSEKLDTTVRDGDELSAADVVARESVLGRWFLEGDLGFIYGPRGLGKTWLALHVAVQVAEGGGVANWKAGRPRRVLYVDGEMPIDGLRERHRALSPNQCPYMMYLQHELLFQQHGDVLNLADPAFQRAISTMCARRNIEVLVLDNLSCLFSDIKENDADSWERVLPWLLDLRRNRIAVIFIAHAGRNGFIRGTSRREDAAFWIVSLTHSDNEEQAEGARFVARFEKNRNSTDEECPPIEWFFKRVPEGQSEVIWKAVTGLDKLRHWVSVGLTSAQDIAVEMGLSKGRVSQLARVAIEQGWLRRDGREYALVEKHTPGVLTQADANEVLEDQN